MQKNQSVTLRGLNYIALMLMLIAYSCVLNGQERKPGNTEPEMAKRAGLISNIESDPKNIPFHLNFLRSFKPGDATLDSQYIIWAGKYPDIKEIPFAIGNYYADQELPGAKDWLLRAVAIDSVMAEAWVLLSQDSWRRGDERLACEYLLKALNTGNAKPKNYLDYAYYFKDKDREKYHTLLSELISKFKGDPISARALSLIARDTEDELRKKQLYDSLYNEYSHAKILEAEYGLTAYFLELLDKDPKEAHELTRKILSDGRFKKWRWADKEKVSRQFIMVDSLLLSGDSVQAARVADSIDLLAPHRAEHIQAEESLLLLKAKVNKYNNKQKAAYDSLISYYSRKPSGKVFSAIFSYAGELTISKDSIYKDIWKIRDSLAKPATRFTLVNFLNGQKVSLNDFKGKVVLLTYWFPGCGPCRREFPFFEKAVSKYTEAVKYVGINLVNKQDDYVVPFMKASGCTFVPLQNDPKWDQGTLRATGAPMNFLIDGQGRIIFSQFFIDEDNYSMLETMISEIIEKG